LDPVLIPPSTLAIVQRGSMAQVEEREVYILLTHDWGALVGGGLAFISVGRRWYIYRRKSLTKFFFQGNN
jgi:hypothetical protein